MTQYNVSVEKVELALSYLTDQQILHKNWSHHYYQHNLTLTAAKHFNSALFSLWSNLGIPPAIESDDYNALDMITSPLNKQQKKAAVEIFKILADENLYPYAVDSLDKINKWLPEKVKKSFSGYFGEQPLHYFSEWEQKQVKTFASYHEKISAKKIKSQQDLINCRNQLPPMPAVSNDLTEAKLNINEQKTVQELLKYFKSIEPETLGLTNKVFDSRAAKGIIDVNEISSELSNEDTTNLQLRLALRNNQPYEKILPLLQAGATLPDIAIIILTINDNIILAEQLKSHGLNLYAQDQKGDNALHYAARMGSSNGMFDYLINEGVDITQGADLLNEVINKINTESDTLHYITQLVNNGLIITTKHEDLLSTFIAVNKIKYSRVHNFIAEQIR